MAAKDITVSICTWLEDAPFAYSMTYDEGTVDALANALPVHQKYGIPGHLDVVPGQIGRRRSAWRSSLNDYMHMSADELKFLIERGWGVGNHSWSHYVHPTQAGLDLYREVVWSKYRLEDMIDHPVRIFTIPNDVHNYPPVIELVKQHYLACAYIDGAPNREGFDLYKIGNFMVAAGDIRPRPGWPEQLLTANLSSDYLEGAWLYETSHLVMWDVPQSHKCVTPEHLSRRFERLIEISESRFWAATPDDVIDYVLMRRNLEVGPVRIEDPHSAAFDIGGSWPVGVINPTLTFRVGGIESPAEPRVELEFHRVAGGYSGHSEVRSIRRDGADWLITMEAAPYRTVRLKF